MNANYSPKISEAVSQFLIQDDWKFEFNEETGIFRLNVNLKGKIRNAQIIVHVRNTDFNVYCLIPICADHRNKEMMRQLSLFLHRANYGLVSGNFELDVNDGDIRYKTYIECEGLEAPSFEMVRNGIYCTLAMLERYNEGITKIIFADMDAATAISICETPNRSTHIDEDDFFEGIDLEDEPPEDAPFDLDPIDENDISELLRMMREVDEM